MSYRTTVEARLGKFPLYEVLGCVAVVLGWDLVTRIGFMDPGLLPSPESVFHAFRESIQNGEFFSSLRKTLLAVLLSFALGGATGIVVGLVAGGSKAVKLIVGPYLYSVYSLPKIAVVPLFVVWLGIGTQTIIVVSALAVTFLVAINTMEGVRTVDPVLIRAALNLGAGRRQIFMRVILPAASGMIMTGLRLGIAQALITVTAAEIVLAGSGLGAWMWDARQSLRTDIEFLCLFTLAVLGVLLTWGMDRIDAIVFPWRVRST